jgi:Tfp pilus assembly protein PilV
VLGFSLAEVLVAIGILTGAALALASVLARALPATIDAGHASRATILASQKIEQLRTAAEIEPSVEFLAGDGTVISSAGAAPRGAIYVRRCVSAPFPGTDAGARIVTVTVEPLSGPSRERMTTVGVVGVP